MWANVGRAPAYSSHDPDCQVCRRQKLHILQQHLLCCSHQTYDIQPRFQTSDCQQPGYTTLARFSTLQHLHAGHRYEPTLCARPLFSNPQFLPTHNAYWSQVFTNSPSLPIHNAYAHSNIYDSHTCAFALKGTHACINANICMYLWMKRHVCTRVWVCMYVYSCSCLHVHSSVSV